MKIAFLGLGRMGRELVPHLLDAGHDVTVWNRSPAPAAALAERGASAAATAAEAVAGAEVVMTVLFGPDAVREVVLDGKLPFPDGALWIDVTTVAPADTDEFAQFARANGIPYVHSPVIGSLRPARARALGVLVGGEDPAAVERATAIVSTWAGPDRLRTYGSPAHAALGKLVANLAIAATTQGLIESLRLGRSGGLTAEDVLDLLPITALGPIVAIKGDAIRERAWEDTQFSTNLLAKDALLMLRTSDAPLPALTACLDHLQEAQRAGNGEWDFSVVVATDRG
jgi:3-hydroxyisobutyrate dehydrogenase